MMNFVITYKKINKEHAIDVRSLVTTVDCIPCMSMNTLQANASRKPTCANIVRYFANLSLKSTISTPFLFTILDTYKKCGMIHNTHLPSLGF